MTGAKGASGGGRRGRGVFSFFSSNAPPLSALVDPPLTSISTHVQEMGRIAVQLAAERMPRTGFRRELPVKVILPPTLVLRGSAAALPGTHESQAEIR